MHWTQRVIKANAKLAQARQRCANASPAGRGNSHGSERDRIMRAATRQHRETLRARGLKV